MSGFAGESLDSVATDAHSIEALFGPDSWTGANTVGLNWHVKLSDSHMGRRESCHKICFRHGQITGKYILIIDGKPEILNGFHPVTARQPARVDFLMQGRKCSIIFDGLKSAIYFTHALFVDDVRYPEARETVDVALQELLPKNILPKAVVVYNDVAYYGFEVVTGAGQKISIHRRFSQFVMLNSLIRAELDYHMVSSLPDLPPKVYNPYFNQLQKSFLEDRLRGLHSYLSQLLGNSKACHYTDLFCFLGLDPLSGLPKDSSSLEQVSEVDAATTNDDQKINV